MSDDGEKSFEATPQKRERFRKEGRFARARDAGGIVAIAAVLGVLMGSRGAIGRTVDLLFQRTLGDLSALGREGPSIVLSRCMGSLLVLAGPPAVAAAVLAAMIGLAQAGGYFNADTLAFKPEKLNPLPKLQELFSFKKGAVESIMSLLRIGVVGYVAYRALILDIPDLIALSNAPLAEGATRLVDSLSHVVVSALVALVVIAVVDYAQSRFSIEKELKMTRQEMMDETRSQEGDPKAKARMRGKARAMLRKRALTNVKSADVVVTNPTHVAVALRYGKRDPAPVVVAKGHDDVAMQIRTLARKYGISIVENRPLARALDAEVQIGQAIPNSHFAAVARVLAFVYRIRRRGIQRA